MIQMKDLIPCKGLASEEVIIHLIREELKSRRFFEALRELGLDDAFYQVDLLDLIMPAIGLSPDSEAHYDFCHDVLSKHSMRVTQDGDELLNEARKVYELLLSNSL